VLIAIDTSTEFASLALAQDDKIIAELSWHCGTNHTVETLPRLSDLLVKANLDIKDTDCILVARGPGSFNGLRAGISAAKGLAFSLNIPVIGISTLEVTAYQHSESGLPVCALQTAGREEIAMAIFQKKSNSWRRIAPEHLTRIEDLPLEIKEKTIFCGEISPENILKIKKLFKSRAIIASPFTSLRRAAFLVELGRQRMRKGDFDDVATLQPIYLRRPPITERKKPF